MTPFHPGQRIVVRGEEWQVSTAKEIQCVGGESVWQITCRGLSGIVRGQDFCFLSDIDAIEILDPSDITPDLDDSKGAQKSLVYLEAHLRRLLPRNGALYLGNHGAFTPYPYQLVPAAKALHKIRQRILIGDAVGLGKTIECGILLSEMIRRGRGKRILCAVPKATLEQFQNEMWGRFSIPFHRLDSTGIQRLKQDLPSTMNPFFHHNRVIISLDTLKIETYRRSLEKCEWDIVVIDEAHNVANKTEGMRGSLRHQVARCIADNCKSLILMSATPHDGTPNGFSSLVKLVDRAAVANDDSYSLDDIKSHFIRRTRSRVNTQLGLQHERRNRIEEVPLYPEEIAILWELHNLKLEHKDQRTSAATGFKELFTTTLIKSFLSSPNALQETLERKIRRLRSSKLSESKSVLHDIDKLLSVQKMLDNLKKPFSRLVALQELVTKMKPSSKDRLVIFTERLQTIKVIRKHLLAAGLVASDFDPKADSQEKGDLIACVDGSLSEQDLQVIVKNFQSEKSGIKILVASNVASEGLNLHACCHRLIHFDLPWSFITLEQRNGRIDRLGQTRTPEITYLASKADSKKAIKDDFWIVNKLKVRQELAARDLDEEALARGFTEGTSEEMYNTEVYETADQGITKEPLNPILAILAGSSSSSEQDLTGGDELYRKDLATLFPGSPRNFVVSASQYLDFKVDCRDTTISLTLSQELRREANRWPREFRPHAEDNVITLESDPEKMAMYYLQCIRNGEEIRRSFLNEIHPTVSLLEDASLYLFAGKKVPTVVSASLPKDSLSLLCQATLFNGINDPIFQGWEVLAFKRGSAKPEPLFGGNIECNDRLQELTEWIREQCRNSTRKSTKIDNSRFGAITDTAIAKMTDIAKEAREARKDAMRRTIDAEARRVRAWCKSREEYLIQLQQVASKARLDISARARAEYAKRELKGLQQETKSLNEYISKVLATNAQPDVQILAVFVGG